jgi:methionyl-tRNA formyltransferase
MRIVFMGSAELSCRCFEAIVADGRHEVAAVVTQPDRPKGRNLEVSPCVAKVHAVRAGIPVLTPANVNAPESLAALRGLAPDLIVVVAYGQILRRPILDLPPRGCVNVHFSLLPKYRGAAPIQWAIVRGEAVTGVTVMFMNERMDAGDLIARQAEPIREDDTAGSLHDRLAAAGGALLVRTLPALADGTSPRTPQDEAQATLAPKIRKPDGRIDWTRRARDIYDHVRGFNPRPGCFCTLTDGNVLRVFGVRPEPASGTPGTVLDSGAEGPLIAAGEGGVRLIDVQPEGGRRMTGGAYLRGHPLGQKLKAES